MAFRTKPDYTTGYYCACISIQGGLVVLGDTRFVEVAVRAPRLGLVQTGQQHTQALFAAVAATEDEVGYLEALE